MSDMRWTHPDGSETIHQHTEGVWQHQCGSQFFYLNDDGSVTCAQCNEVLCSLTWRKDVVQ